jgi:hypothetical protein
VSCGSASNCSAGGICTDNSGHTQPFVDSESWTLGKRRGRGGVIVAVPLLPTAALASAQARSSFSAACGVFARPPPALLLGPAARPTRTAAVRAWPLGA